MIMISTERLIDSVNPYRATVNIRVIARGMTPNYASDVGSHMIQIMRDAGEMILALWETSGGTRTGSAVLALGIVCTDRNLAGRCVDYALLFWPPDRVGHRPAQPSAGSAVRGTTPDMVLPIAGCRPPRSQRRGSLRSSSKTLNTPGTPIR
jgi:hypothetical protein